MSAKDRIVSADSGEQSNDLYPRVMCSVLVMCIDARSSDSAGVTRRREAGICKAEMLYIIIMCIHTDK